MAEIDPLSKYIGRFEALFEKIEDKLDQQSVDFDRALDMQGKAIESRFEIVRDELIVVNRKLSETHDANVAAKQSADAANSRLDTVRLELDGDANKNLKGLKATVSEHEAIKNKGFFAWAMICAAGSIIIAVVGQVVWALVKPLVMGGVDGGAEPPMIP